MADSNLKFVEEGLKIQASIADKMDELMAAGGTIAISAPGIGTIIGVAVFVIGLIKAMGDDDAEIINALKTLQKQIDEIKVAITILDERLDELVDQVANESNRQTLRDLLDYLDQFRILENELVDRPHDLETAVRVANEAGIVIDKFLRNDFEIWRWTDVVLKEFSDPTTGQVRRENALSLMRFKNIPTLPVYVVGLMTWLAAREKAVKAGARSRLSDDQPRLERHRAATAIRPNFDKYRDGENGTPQSIAEHIKWRIRAYAVASTPYPRDRVCQFYFVIGSMMTGKTSSGPLESFDLVMPPGTDTCFIDPGMLGSPNGELELETKAGLDTLYELSELLGRLSGGGSLAPPFVGRFPNIEVFPPATLYTIDLAANLQWHRNESSSARGGSKEWTGPKQVGNGWGGFTKVFNAGGPAIYAIKPDGDLLWYAHDGFIDGSSRWRGWNKVGNGWQGFRHVFSTGEHVVYGVQPDGRLLWYRHDGAYDGGDVNTWVGQKEVASGWQVFDKVFSGGDGVLYGIRADGVLERRRHKGYLSGTPDWEAPEEIGTGWQGFREVVGSFDGVIYAFTQDGRILWYRYAKRRPPPPPAETPDVGERITEHTRWSDMAHDRSRVEGMITERPRHGGVLHPEVIRPWVPGLEIGPIFTIDAEVWEGPVEIKRNFPAFRSVFALMGAPFRGPN